MRIDNSINDGYFRVCPTCNGTGVGQNGPCLTCGGVKKHFIYANWFPEGIYPTYKILEATDPAEYVALAPGNVALYNLIISAGTIDLGATTTALAVLFGMFGVGTTTRTNLETLIA